MESVEDRVYRRTVRLKDKKGNDICGRVEVRNNDSKAVLEVTMSESLLHVMPQLLTRVKHLFDLYCDPESVKSVLAKIDEIKPNAFVWGIRVPGCIDPFEASVRAVLGQQITVKAAGTLAGRFAEKFGKPVDTGDAALMYVFPTAEEIAALEGNIEDHLGKIGIIAARARTIKELARYFAGRGDVRGVPKHDMERLLKIKGIGPWTANYIAMRAFGYTDAFLDADYGVKLAFPEMKPKEIRELSERWSPWRSYAMMMLWNIES